MHEGLIYGPKLLPGFVPSLREKMYVGFDCAQELDHASKIPYLHPNTEHRNLAYVDGYLLKDQTEYH
mgnify:CR=1 FL=1